MTSAAAVMAGVFAIFFRGALLPAAMKLLGDWNWYLPRWLEWLPQLNAEPETPKQWAPKLPPAPALN